MAKMTEYPRATSFDPKDILLKDGSGGTQKIEIEDVLTYLFLNLNDPTLTDDQKFANAKAVGDILFNLFGDVSSTYDPDSTYEAGQYVIYDNKLYRAKADISTPEAWNAEHWDKTTVMQEISDLRSEVDALILTNTKKYGVKFTGSVSAGERLFDAVGLTAAVGTDTQTAENDFDNIEPWASIRRCNTTIVDGERVPTFFEGEAGYSNTEADVFVYVPLFYYFRSDDDSTHVVAMKPLDNGFRAPAKFHRADGTLRDHVFLAAYEIGMKDGIPVSRSGFIPYSVSLNTYMSTSKEKHTSGDLDADLWIEGMKDDEIRNILMDIEFATRNHQTHMMGACKTYRSDVRVTGGGTNQFTISTTDARRLVVGQTIAIGTTSSGEEIEPSGIITSIDSTTGVIQFTPSGDDVTVENGNYISSRPWKTGSCDSVKSSSGSLHDNTSGLYPCVWRGCENPWCNTFHYRWDFLSNNNQGYVLDDPENYAASIGAHHTALSYKIATGSGYAARMGFDPTFSYARITVAIGGGSTTYFGDYYFQASGVKCLVVGGCFGIDINGGPRYYGVSDSPSKVTYFYAAALSPL